MLACFVTQFRVKYSSYISRVYLRSGVCTKRLADGYEQKQNIVEGRGAQIPIA